MFRCMGCMAEIQQNTEPCPHCGYVNGTPPREAYHLAPGSVLDGRYIVGRVLGYGGFGVTYIGWDAELERVVAIKEYLPSSFASRMPGDTHISVYEGQATEQYGFGLERFVDEAQRLAKFNGVAGIVNIYDTFDGNNTAYIVMEFLQGQDIKQILEANGPLPFEVAKDIVLKVCEALEPVHEKGIIHRDISPDNIYLTAEGEIKLLDFGAARYESSANSKSLSVILKSGYAPEEQYRSRGDQGSWTDVYALAATLYKMLTGVTPSDSMERAIKDELKEPSKLGVVLPDNAENALMNALNIRGENRTQTVAEFSRALSGGEVERVKEKRTRSDSGRIPVWGKVLLGGGVGLALVFAMLTTARRNEPNGEVVTSLAAPQLLQDDYGPAVAEGMAMVPNVMGMNESAAGITLDASGLGMQTAGYRFYDGMGEGVSQQDPAAGKQLELGSDVTVKLNGGGVQQAIQNGLLQDPVGMQATNAVGVFGNIEADRDILFRHIYSDAAAGTVAGIETGEDAIYLLVSAGGDDIPGPGGQLRAPLISMGEYGPVISVAAPSHDDDEVHTAGMVLYYSTDRSNWAELTYVSASLRPHEAGGVPQRADELWPMLTGDDFGFLEGQQIYLYYSRNLYAPDYYTGPGEYGSNVQRLELEQGISYAYNGDIEVYCVQVLGWDEVLQNYENGLWDKRHDLVNAYFTYQQAADPAAHYEQIVPLRILGNFEEENLYQVRVGDSFKWTDGIYEDGALYLKAPVGDLDGFNVEVAARRPNGVDITEDGGLIQMYGHRAGKYYVDRGSSEINVRGMKVDEAAESIVAALRAAGEVSGEPSIYVNTRIDSSMDAGRVLSWSSSTSGGLTAIEIIASVGANTEAEIHYLGSVFGGRALSNGGPAVPYLAVTMAGYVELDLSYEISEDGGSSWQQTHASSLQLKNHENGIFTNYFIGTEELASANGAMARVRLYNTLTGELMDELVIDLLPELFYDT